jgi:hypothetical protein
MRIHASLAASAACDAFDVGLLMRPISASVVHFATTLGGETNLFVAHRASPELMT